MPRRIFRSRAYQFAHDPESLVMITLSGSRGESSHADALRIDRIRGSHRAFVPASSTNPRRSFRSCSATTGPASCSSSGSSSAQGLRAVTHQVHFHRIAQAEHVRLRDRSARRAPAPSFGRNSRIGKPDPIISSVSHSIIMSQLGFVPSNPIDPVTHGNSSGNAALPSSALATPAPSLSATAITSSVA